MEQLYPLLLLPEFHERIWGTRDLSAFYPSHKIGNEPIGEVWLTGEGCRVANGALQGRTLGELAQHFGERLNGTLAPQARFPLLVKIIFPKEKLSIQVHPDDAYAAVHERGAGGRGKTEMWHIVSAKPGARLLAGLKPGTTKEKFRAALASSKLEELFEEHEVHAGDSFFLPAGTPHTIGPDMIVCEVQEYSDLTYRVCDYERVDSSGKPRELHIEKALEVIDFGSRVHAKIQGTAVSFAGHKMGENLVSCSYFEASRIEISQPFHMKSMREPQQSFELWAFMEGEGIVEWECQAHDFSRENSRRFAYKPGECWFIPAVFGSHGFLPKKKTSVLMASPRNPKLVAKQSRDAG